MANWVKQHCCEMMTGNVENTCESHPNRFDCADMLVHYEDDVDAYGLIIHDGGGSVIGITFCPWCGAALRDLSDQLLAELDALGFEDHDDDAVPEKYRSSAWWREREA